MNTNLWCGRLYRRITALKSSFPDSHTHMTQRLLLATVTLLSYLLLPPVAASIGVNNGDNRFLCVVLSLQRLCFLIGEKERKDSMAEAERIGEECSQSDLVVDQDSTEPLPTGIPAFLVQITNQCASGCNISRIHVSCGWFGSATLIEPSLFKRLRYNDCLVNNGQSLPFGATLSFSYANSFLYTLSISSFSCSH